MNQVDHLIVGAGPAGLATAGRMRKAGLSFQIIEQGSHPGERWHHHYDRVCLHSVKKWSHLPHLPFPEDYPTYVPRDLLTRYFESYVQTFDIHPDYGTELLMLEQHGDGGWIAKTTGGDIRATDVIIATGVNRIPNRPKWSGMDQFNGQIVHSIDYRNPDPFLKSKVLVIGMGNTGAEIALDLANAHVNTTLSVRSELSIVPRDLNGKPVQETAKILDRLPWGIGDWLGSKVQSIYFGDLTRYGLRRSKVPPAIMLMQTAKTPVIDIGTVRAIKAGRIHVRGEVRAFMPQGVEFTDGSREGYDHVILATGYRLALEQFIEGVERMLDPHGYPVSPIGSGAFEGLYFVGFDNYKLGGILGTIFTDSETVVNALRSKI